MTAADETTPRAAWVCACGRYSEFPGRCPCGRRLPNWDRDTPVEEAPDDRR